MDDVKPTQPKSRTRKKKEEDTSIGEMTPTNMDTTGNKYARKKPIGTPQLGNTRTVDTVGLGKLKVTTY